MQAFSGQNTQQSTYVRPGNGLFPIKPSLDYSSYTLFLQLETAVLIGIRVLVQLRHASLPSNDLSMEVIILHAQNRGPRAVS